MAIVYHTADTIDEYLAILHALRPLSLEDPNNFPLYLVAALLQIARAAGSPQINQ